MESLSSHSDTHEKLEGQSLSVLVVDQEEHLALMFRDALIEKGLACDALASPFEALQRLRKTSYDILVTDISMQMMSGLRLMKEARSVRPHLRVMFVSSKGDLETAVEAMKQGASDFIKKPFEMDTLCRRVVKLAQEIADASGENEQFFFEPDTRNCPDLPGYKVLRPLGAGAMGSVFLARQLTLNRLVAIKVIRPSVFSSSQAQKRFVQEAEMSAKMNHPNIIHTHVMIKVKGYLFLVLEYFPSRPLSRIVTAKRPLPWQKATWVTLQMARALVHASSRGIIHRDIKPGNILVGKGWVSKIADFGLAKQNTFVHDRDPESGITQVGKIVGTPAYMSPEQAMARKDIDVRTDIYSLGLCLWYMLEGHNAYSGQPMELVAYQVRRQVPELTVEDVPEELRSILAQMTRKDPEERYANAAELLAALRKVHNLQPTDLAQEELPGEAEPEDVDSKAETQDMDGQLFGFSGD